MSPPLGLYVDAPFRSTADGTVSTTPEAFGFLCFALHVAGPAGLLVYGRQAPPELAVEHALPGPARLVALPYYRDLTAYGAVARAVPGTVRAMWRGLRDTETVWVFGPHPMGLVLIALGILRRRRVVLGVRQDTRAYFRSRLRGGRARPILAALGILDMMWRLASRRLPTTVVGAELERGYGGPRPGVLAMTVSLVRNAEVAATPQERDWGGRVDLLTVGRVDVEKDPQLLLEALAQLDARHHLTWVGSGPLLAAAREHAERLGVSGRLELAGFVPYGPALLERYRTAHAFVHVARTEGSPQVLAEAMACGLPIVATAVGGVAAALDHGRAGLLVAPGDAAAVADAVRALGATAEGRGARARRGLELARERSLEAESARVARWLGVQQVPLAVQGSSARR